MEIDEWPLKKLKCKHFLDMVLLNLGRNIRYFSLSYLLLKEVYSVCM